MRAAQLITYRAPLSIDSVTDPVCPPDGVILKVLACGVCRSDWHAWVGHDPDVVLPLIPGHEFCGEILEIGDEVRDWTVGDQVIAPFILGCGRCGSCRAGNQTICATQAVPGFTIPGAFAEMIAVPHADTNLAKLPQGMDCALAAALGCRATTAWQALTARAEIRPGEWLAVFGGGGIGLASLILARAIGARVVVVDVVDEKLKFASAHGADATINATKTDPVAAIEALTNGGAHVAFEALGIQETTVNALKSLRKFGRLVQIGMPVADHANMQMPMDVLYSGQLTIHGTRGMPAHRYPSLFSLIEGGHADLSPMISRRIRLSDASSELAAFDAPTPPGVAVITDFSA